MRGDLRGSSIAHGRETFRTRSTIAWESSTLNLNHSPVFCTDALFICAEDKVGAPSAQVR